MNDEPQVDVTKEREKFIGGSECAAANGLSPWQTPAELWAVKRGLIPPVAETPAMAWGKLLEPLVREETGYITRRVYRVPPGRIMHPVHKFAACHPDGISDDRVLLEVKTARTAEGWGEPGGDQIPMHYTAQVQWNLACCGLEVADVSVLIAGAELRLYEIPADPELIEMLLEGGRKFWAFVESGERPPVDYAAPGALALIKKLYPGTTGEVVKATTEMQAARWQLEEAKADEKRAREVVDAKMAELLDYMKDAALLEFEDGRALRRQEVSRKEYVVKATKWMDARFINSTNLAALGLKDHSRSR